MKTNNTPNRQNGEAFEQVNDDFSNKNSQAKANKVARMHIEWSEDENRVTQMAGLVLRGYFGQPLHVYFLV